MIERRREAWWTVYVLDRQMSSLLGCCVAFPDDDVNTRLPAFQGSVQTSLALGIHVKLCKAATVILQSELSLDGLESKCKLTFYPQLCTAKDKTRANVSLSR